MRKVVWKIHEENFSQEKLKRKLEEIFKTKLKKKNIEVSCAKKSKKFEKISKKN